MAFPSIVLHSKVVSMSNLEVETAKKNKQESKNNVHFFRKHERRSGGSSNGDGVLVITSLTTCESVEFSLRYLHTFWKCRLSWLCFLFMFVTNSAVRYLLTCWVFSFVLCTCLYLLLYLFDSFLFIMTPSRYSILFVCVAVFHFVKVCCFLLLCLLGLDTLNVQSLYIIIIVLLLPM